MQDWAVFGDEEFIERCNKITHKIIGAAMEVHRFFGPGMLENTYEICLCHELRLRGLKVERQLAQPVHYKGIDLDCGYRLDILVEGIIVVEIKAVEKLQDIHEAQLQTYLRLTENYIGLLLNFNEIRLKDGIRRSINSRAIAKPAPPPL